jgi:hypothetical protein
LKNEYRERVREVSEGNRVDKSSGGIVSFFSLKKSTQQRSHRTRVAEHRSLRRGRESATWNRRADSRVPWIVGSGRRSEAVNPQAQGKSFAVAHRRIGVGERKDFMHVEVATLKFPI